MINKKSLIVSLILAGTILFSEIAFAQFNVGTPPPGIPDTDIGQVIINGTNWILGIIGVLAVLYLIWGGLKYITAAGDDNEIEEAKTVITYAVWGLLIAGVAYAAIAVVVNVWIKGSF